MAINTDDSLHCTFSNIGITSSKTIHFSKCSNNLPIQTKPFTLTYSKICFNIISVLSIIYTVCFILCIFSHLTLVIPILIFLYVVLTIALLIVYQQDWQK